MDKKPKDLIYFDEAVEFPKELKAMEDKKLTPREMCVFALSSMGEGATVGDIMEAVDKYVLSLGVQSEKLLPNEITAMMTSKEEMLRHAGLVQSPAPDENGLLEENKRMIEAFRDIWDRGLITLDELREIIPTRTHAPIQKPQDWEATKHVIFNGIEDAYAKGRLDGLVMTYIMEFLEPKLDSLLAPSGGKDQEIDRLKAQGDEFIAQRDHLLAKLKLEREKSSKLIEALERICGMSARNEGMWQVVAESIKIIAKKALSAYKGKEAKEGGEG